MADAPLVEVRDLDMAFPVGRAGGRPVMMQVLKQLSFDIAPGETLGLVGESGSGKSTIGRILVGLLEPTAGSVKLFGRDITGADRKSNLAAVRSRLQFVFQDPQAALNPRMRVGESIAEPLDIAGGQHDRQARIRELLEMVGLPKDSAERFPHEFSGGQRQRIVIARALALKPDFVVCDEPVSALDVSMQAQIVNLLQDLQARLGLGYLFIAHDLAVVRAVAQRVAVMYAGSLVEVAPRAALYRNPQHPYTQALLDAVPRPDPDRIRRPVIGGEVPSLLDPPPGCRFHTRCPHAMPRCRVEVPLLRQTGPGHFTACHLTTQP
ncbi:MAG: ABC transporter ATP-binding protein [Betaproteobacteria bacterium]|nr:ABC transporter ATP-binding protein [Betaproteobacteria bacterium]